MIPIHRISGPLLRAAARAVRTQAGAAAAYHTFRKELAIHQLEALPPEARGDLPLHNRPLQARAPRQVEDRALPPPPAPWSGTSASYVEAYRSGRATPEAVALDRVRAARELERHQPSVGPFYDSVDEARWRAEAVESAERYRRGQTLGPFDGVPYAVKEQIGVDGLARQGGTRYLARTPSEDGTCVGRMRGAGAVVLGTTSMTEFGMNPMGHSRHRNLPKNPHDTTRLAGGSSTGSGVAVATGLLPFAIGADGGGSIRIPAAMNGVFGIKPTWGRVSRAGDISGGSVAHVGPLASSTADLARVLEAIGGPDPRDGETERAPATTPGMFTRAIGRGVRGLRIAVDEGEWRDASDAVARAGREALGLLEREGAVLVPTRIPLAAQAPAIGFMTIGLETCGLLRQDFATKRAEWSWDLQVTMAALHRASAADYVDAQRLRSGLRRAVADVFATVDLIALPTTVTTAAAATDAEMTGFLDTTLLQGLCRFNFLGNLTGLPALSAPVGVDAAGLPIGLQLLGDAWDEATVLAAAAHLERTGGAVVRRPRVAAPCALVVS